MYPETQSWACILVFPQYILTNNNNKNENIDTSMYTIILGSKERSYTLTWSFSWGWEDYGQVMKQAQSR